MSRKYNRAMGRKRKLPSIEAINDFTEQFANAIFIPPIDPNETPKFTFACRLWGRDLFCVVMRGNQTKKSTSMLEFIRKQTQREFKASGFVNYRLALVIFNCPTWDNVSPIKHFGMLADQEGGDFDLSLPGSDLMGK